MSVPYGLDYGNFIGGGNSNCIGTSSSKATNSIIVGGSQNLLNNTTHSAILGGLCNLIADDPLIGNSFIVGGCNSIYASKSFIIGQNSTIIHSGAGIISDGRPTISRVEKISQGPYTLTLDFLSGTYIKNRTILQSDSYVPSTYTSYGVSGQLAFDDNYFYRHNGTNWTRTALSIW
jgi:hypothetical protein